MDRVPASRPAWIRGLPNIRGAYQRKVTLIGWSLGGVFACEMARGRDARILRPVCQPSDRRGGSRDPSIGEQLRERKSMEKLIVPMRGRS